MQQGMLQPLLRWVLVRFHVAGMLLLVLDAHVCYFTDNGNKETNYVPPSNRLTSSTSGSEESMLRVTITATVATPTLHSLKAHWWRQPGQNSPIDGQGQDWKQQREQGCRAHAAWRKQAQTISWALFRKFAEPNHMRHAIPWSMFKKRNQIKSKSWLASDSTATCSLHQAQKTTMKRTNHPRVLFSELQNSSENASISSATSTDHRTGYATCFRACSPPARTGKRKMKQIKGQPAGMRGGVGRPKARGRILPSTCLWSAHPTSHASERVSELPCTLASLPS